LEECFDEHKTSVPDILNHCNDEELCRLISSDLSEGVYKKDDVAAVVTDTIKFIKRNKLEDARNKLMQRIKNYVINTEDDKRQFNTLLAEKMELDKQVQTLLK